MTVPTNTPGTGMVERIARAIDPEVWIFWDAGEEWHRDQQVIDRRAEAFSKAIAALEALREPSEAMLAAAELAYAVPWVRPMANAYAALIDAATIDAALSEHKGK